MARITGIGGVFFKSKGDHKALAAWYQKHLGIKLESWGGAVLRWPQDTAEDKGATAWKVAENDTKWFSPSESSFMINYRIDNMDEMVEQLRTGGVPIHQGPESHEHRKYLLFLASLPSFAQEEFGRDLQTSKPRRLRIRETDANMDSRERYLQGDSSNSGF